MSLSDEYLIALATIHLGDKSDGDTVDLLSLLRAVESAACQDYTKDLDRLVVAERERCVSKIDKVTAKMSAECPSAVNGWWPDQVGYKCIQAIQGGEQ